MHTLAFSCPAVYYDSVGPRNECSFKGVRKVRLSVVRNILWTVDDRMQYTSTIYWYGANDAMGFTRRSVDYYACFSLSTQSALELRCSASDNIASQSTEQFACENMGVSVAEQPKRVSGLSSRR